MFERPRTGERAVLVHWSLGCAQRGDDLAEFQELSDSAGVTEVAVVTTSRAEPDPRFLIGSGKAEEIRALVAEHQAEVALFNAELTPAQERNLESVLKCRVVDRTGLILDIFAQRARSFEGKLQVELAQLRHLSTRLVRGWTHLERQRGGIGLRGPGETQLETDRRLLAERIKQIKRRLGKVASQRSQGRQGRRKGGVPTIALVGYTNAGKSTLFNRLTQASVYTADRLFATLDPTLRRLALPPLGDVVLADTVGFISALPHELIAAFRATLQETCEASLLVHVVDASDPRHAEHADQVDQVLAAIGAGGVPCVRVYNKSDLMEDAPRGVNGAAVWVSARTGAGLDDLRERLVERLRGDLVHAWVRLPVAAGRLRARLFSLGAVLTERLNDDGEWLLEVRTTRQNWQRLCHQDGFQEAWSKPAATA